LELSGIEEKEGIFVYFFLRLVRLSAALNSAMIAAYNMRPARGVWLISEFE
jgi:hypothetical protein